MAKQEVVLFANSEELSSTEAFKKSILQGFGHDRVYDDQFTDKNWGQLRDEAERLLQDYETLSITPVTEVDSGLFVDIAFNENTRRNFGQTQNEVLYTMREQQKAAVNARPKQTTIVAQFKKDYPNYPKATIAK